MTIINIYLKFALIAIGLVGGIILSITMGFWYGFPLILMGLIFLASYLLLGTIGSAGQIMQTQDFDAAEKRLDLTFFPNLLYVNYRPMYYLVKGSIAAQKKDTDTAERLFTKALKMNFPSDNEKAMVLLQLSNIHASKQKWNVAKRYFQDLKKLKVTQPEIKEQIAMYEKAMSQSGQVRAQQRMMAGGRGGRQTHVGGKRRRPKMR